MTIPASTGGWKAASKVLDVNRLERGRRKARLIARSLGHVLSDWEDDTISSSIAHCLVCEDLAAVDAHQGQPTELLGHVLTRQCPGDRIW